DAGPTDLSPPMVQHPRWDDREEAYVEPAAPRHQPAHQPAWDDGDDGRYAERQESPDRQWAQRYLAVHEVEKSVAGRRVVKGASLYWGPGVAVGLLGPNGAGKTTVFYMITGLGKADHGRIELDGHDIPGLPMYQHGRLSIGYLPQEASIFRGLNV